MILDLKAPAIAGGLALLLGVAGCGSNDKGESPKVASDLLGTATGGGSPPPDAGTTSGPDGTSAGTPPTGPANNGLPYGDGLPGEPPTATVGAPAPVDLAPKAKDAPAEPKKDAPKS